MTLNPQACAPGQEQHEKFKPAHRRGQTFVQFDYRAPDGELFSCVKKTLADCRAARDAWEAGRAAKMV